MSPFPVADAHVDLITHLLEQRPPQPLRDVSAGPVTAAGLVAGNVRFLVCTFYVADAYNGPETAHRRLLELMEAMASMTAPLHPALTPQSMKRLLAEPTGAPGYCHLVENSDALLEADLDALQQRGVRLAGLTHVGANRLADGNAVSAPHGLRPEGKALLRRLDRAGWAVDVAHLAEPGFWEVIERHQGPLLSSHTGLRAFHDTPRNLSDAQADALHERGGRICLTVAPEILDAHCWASVATVVEHVDHLAQRHGETKHLGIGSDFGGFEVPCQGLEDCSRFQALAQALLARGYGEADVAGIMGGNLINFLSRLYAA